MNHDDWLEEDAFTQSQEIADFAAIIGIIAIICGALVFTWILYFITS